MPTRPSACGPERIVGAVWGVWGVAEFKLRLQADFNLWFHTPCTPGRGAADQKPIQNRCKIDAGKRHAKSIADAERHRRTPWTLAIESKTIRGKKWADIGDTSEKKNPQNMPKSSTYDFNGNQNRCKINEKSKLRF